MEVQTWQVRQETAGSRRVKVPAVGSSGTEVGLDVLPLPFLVRPVLPPMRAVLLLPTVVPGGGL